MAASWLAFVGTDDNYHKVVVIRKLDDKEGLLEPVVRLASLLRTMQMECLTFSEFKRQHPDKNIDHLSNAELTAGTVACLQKKCGHTKKRPSTSNAASPPGSQPRRKSRRIRETTTPSASTRTEAASSGSEKHLCDVCGKQCASAGALGNHKKTHQPKECRQCRALFSTQAAMKAHTCRLSKADIMDLSIPVNGQKAPSNGPKAAKVALAKAMSDLQAEKETAKMYKQQLELQKEANEGYQAKCAVEAERAKAEAHELIAEMMKAKWEEAERRREEDRERERERREREIQRERERERKRPRRRERERKSTRRRERERERRESAK